MTTRLELRDLLEKRVGWLNEPSFPISVSSQNQENEGRYFQDEHEFVCLENVHELIRTVNADEEKFNAELSILRKRVVLSVIDETFADMNIANISLEGCENIFDAAISKRMAMKLGEILMTTNRKNFTERNGKYYVKYIYIELNGNANFPDKIGISTSYKKELDRLRDIFNTDDMLDSFTMTNNPNETLDNYRFEPR